MEPIMITIPMEALENYMRKSAQLDAIVAYVNAEQYSVNKSIVLNIAGVKKEVED